MIIKLRTVLIVVAVAAVALVGIGCWRLVDWKPVADNSESPKITVAQQSSGETERSFFPYFRLQREKIRSQQLELLEKIINNPNTDDKTKQSALTRLLAITNAMDMELKAEGLLKAQGFKEGVVILQDAAASVIISGAELGEKEEAQIKSQIAGVLKMSSQQISLINRE